MRWSHSMAESVGRCISVSRETQLNLTALNQADELFKLTDEVEVVNRLRAITLSRDVSKFNEGSDMLSENAEQLQEVCKLLFHVAPTDHLQSVARSCESRVACYWPQLLHAFQSSCFQTATRNLDALTDVWLSLYSEAHRLTCQVRQLLKLPGSSLRRFPPPSPVPGSPYPSKRVTIQPRADEDVPAAASFTSTSSYFNAPAEGAPLPHQMQEPLPIPTAGAAAADRWPDTKDNDIVKRARAMRDMAVSMHEFTHGSGELKTTQDLFTQAEFFAEEANKFYKVVRHFTYQVGEGEL